MEEKELFKCKHCGAEFEELDENDLCIECCELYVYCDECGAHVHDGDTHTAVRSSCGTAIVICDDCHDNAFVCDRCDDLIVGDSYTVDGGHWCTHCADNYASTCDRCSCATEETYNVETEYGSENWCGNCVGDAATRCDCGTRHHYEIDCPSCDGDGDDSSDGIRSYDYKPMPKFIGDGDRFFGVELEIEAIHGKGAFNVPSDDGYSNVYYKHDGSLTCGYEIVTHPHSLEAFYESYDNKTGLFGVIGELQEKARSHQTRTCGLHIHVSRPRAITTAKMMLFVYRNIEMFERLCRRETNNYCSHGEIPSIDRRSNTLLSGGSRYAALADRGNTIEFRLPRGTLKASTVMATIELLHALVRYCEITPVVKLNQADFISFCGTYKFLPKYDRFLKVVLSGKIAVAEPRRKVEDEYAPSQEAIDRYTNELDIRIAGSTPDRCYDEFGVSTVFRRIGTTAMEVYSADIIDHALSIAESTGFINSYSLIDAVLIATVDKFRAMDYSMDRIYVSVIISSRVDRARYLFRNVQ